MADILKLIVIAILWAIGKMIVWLARLWVASVANFLIGLNVILFCLVLVVDWIK